MTQHWMTSVYQNQQLQHCRIHPNAHLAQWDLRHYLHTYHALPPNCSESQLNQFLASHPQLNCRMRSIQLPGSSHIDQLDARFRAQGLTVQHQPSQAVA